MSATSLLLDVVIFDAGRLPPPGLLERHGYGYEVSASVEAPFGRDRFQDVLVYAYRRADRDLVTAAPN